MADCVDYHSLTFGLDFASARKRCSLVGPPNHV